jgi:predicted ATPase
MIQAFRDLIRQLLSEPLTALENWRNLIQSAVGDNGRIITDVIPDVETIIGPQHPAPVLGPSESEARFTNVFQRFISVFGRPGRPLVLFLGMHIAFFANIDDQCLPQARFTKVLDFV